MLGDPKQYSDMSACTVYIGALNLITTAPVDILAQSSPGAKMGPWKVWEDKVLWLILNL